MTKTALLTFQVITTIALISAKTCDYDFNLIGSPTAKYWKSMGVVVNEVVTTCSEGNDWVCYDNDDNCSCPCKGNNDYCSAFACDHKSKCQCIHNSVDCILLSVDGFMIEYGDINCINTTEDPVFNTRQLLQLDGCSAFYSDLCFRITCESDEFHVASWQLDTINGDFNFTGISHQECLPKALESFSATVLLTVTNANQAIMFVFSQVGKAYCEIHDCFFCWDVFSSYSCLPLFVRRTVLCIVVLIACILGCYSYRLVLKSILLTITVICRLFVMTYQCLSCPAKCWRIRCTRYIRTKMSRCYARCRYALKDEAEEQYDFTGCQPEPEAPAPRRTSRPSKFVPGVGTVFFCLPLLFLFVSPAKSLTCVFSPAIQSQLQTCWTVGSLEFCNMTFSTQLTIPSSNAASCFRIDFNNKTYGTFKFNYWAAQDAVGLSAMYYTSSWKAAYASKHHCYSVDACTESQCIDITEDNIRDALGEITNVLITDYPGVTTCRRSCGGMTCGCGLTRDGCVFSGYSIRADGPIFKVLSPISRTRTFKLGWEYTSATVKKTNFSFSGPSIGSGGMMMNLIGQYSPNQLIFGSGKIVHNDSVHFFAPTSAKGSPLPGMIGDIQASSSLAAMESDFSMNLGITTIENQKSTSYTFVAPGLALPRQAILPKFPISFDGTVWIARGDTVNGVVVNSGPLTVSISTLTPFTISRTVEVVCPEGTFISIQGCYSCTAGFEISVNLHSVCSPGLVYIDSDTLDLMSETVEITNSPSIYVLRASSDHKSVNDVIHVRGTNTVKSITVSGILIEYIDDVNINLTSASEVDDHDRAADDTFFADWVKDFKTGDLSLFGWLWTILLFFIGTAAIIVFILLVYKAIAYAIAASGKSKSG